MSHFEWTDVDVNAGNTVIGIISNIDYENLTADVEGIGVAIPIHYHCDEDAIEDSGKSFDVDYPDEQDEEGAFAFSEDEEVVVMYRRVNNEDPVIVGFADEAMVCAGEYALIELSLVDKISRCIVWDIKGNRLATDVTLNSVEEEEEILATFPCNPDNISEWLDKHLNVGEDLYSEWVYGYQDGEYVWQLTYDTMCSPPNGCPPPAPPESAWWQTGACSSSNEEDSEVPNRYGETIENSYLHTLYRTCEEEDYGKVNGVETQYEMIQAFRRKAPPYDGYNYGLFGSWKLGVRNFEEDKWTCVREQRTNSRNFTYFNIEDTFGVWGDDYGTNTYLWETPLGILGELEYNGSVISCFQNASKCWISPNYEHGYTTEQRTLWNWNSRIKGAQFSDRSIIQIFFHDLYRESRYKNCAELAWNDGYYVFSNAWEFAPQYDCIGEPLAWHQTAYERFDFIQAQANDLFSQGGTENYDPTQLNQSSMLEDAVMDLIGDFYNFNGAAENDIWNFNTEITIRDKDETIIP